jgi:hypothetical protein
MKQILVTAEQIEQMVDQSAQVWASFIEERGPEITRLDPFMPPLEVCMLLAKAIRMSGNHVKKETPN